MRIFVCSFLASEVESRPLRLICRSLSLSSLFLLFLGSFSGVIFACFCGPRVYVSSGVPRREAPLFIAAAF